MAVIKRCKICGKHFSGEGDTGPICLEHDGLVGKYYVKRSGIPNPDEYISMVELCNIAESMGKSRGWVVKLTGGDGGVKPPENADMTVYQFGRRKYCRKVALRTIQELARLEGEGK